MYRRLLKPTDCVLLEVFGTPLPLVSSSLSITSMIELPLFILIADDVFIFSFSRKCDDLLTSEFI
jgi:hypothetical protein